MAIQGMHVDRCWRAGRGPALQRAHYDKTGALLKAIDYRNPDGDVWHLLFIKMQVFMFTPEEVENCATSVVNWSDSGKAAVVCVGQSSWLTSFAPDHLKGCKHFRIMFYDEFLDVICEDIAAERGLYASNHV